MGEQVSEYNAPRREAEDVKSIKMASWQRGYT